jgi:hypothetical protein
MSEDNGESLIQNLYILQQNCQKSRDVSLSLINSTNLEKYNIILIQEPYIYLDTHLTMGTSKWIPIYPAISNNVNEHLKSIIFISTHIPSSTFCQIAIPTCYITMISLQLPEEQIDIYNIYNPPYSDAAHM